MSYFGVTVEKIEDVFPIEGADRIERARLVGMSFDVVIAKGSFKKDDPCLYFMVDSLIPEEILVKMGLSGKLSGNKKNRVKTKCMKGVPSQGLVGPVSLVDFNNEFFMSPSSKISDTKEAKEDFGVKIAEFLGVVKYEPPEIACKGGNLHSLPPGLSMYDIEGADREVEMLEMLMDIPVEVTEKCEGSNFSTSVKSDNDVSGDGIKVWVSQRRHTIVPLDDGSEHTWWKIAREGDIVDFGKWIIKNFINYEDQMITIYGEALGPGIQGNYYEFPNHTALIFDIKIGDSWIGPEERMKLINDFNTSNNSHIQHVPVISTGKTLREWLNGKSMKDASTGNSLLNSAKLREGIVVKPCNAALKFGNKRLFIKQRDPIYLDKTGN